MNRNRGSWYLLTGLIIGLGIGLFYGWVFKPPISTETNLMTLKASIKDEYRVLIAQSYVATEDLVRAKARLELLDTNIDPLYLEQLAQSLQSKGGFEFEAQALARLAADLKASYD